MATIWTRLDRDATEAFRIVREATDLLRDVQAGITGAAFVKSDASPVTVADLAVQAVVSARLTAVAPGDPLVAEEDAAWLRDADERLQWQVVTRFDRALRAFASTSAPVLMDSHAKHVVLAAGAADLFMRFPARRDFHDAIWDYAAGSLLVEEAGGRVSDLTGRPLDFAGGRTLLRNEGILASNGRLHEAALLATKHAG